MVEQTDMILAGEAQIRETHEMQAGAGEDANVVFEQAIKFATQFGTPNISGSGGRFLRASALGFTVYCWDRGFELCVDIWPHWTSVRVQRSAHGRRKLFSARKRRGQLLVASFWRGLWEDAFLEVAQGMGKQLKT